MGLSVVRAVNPWNVLGSSHIWERNAPIEEEKKTSKHRNVWQEILRNRKWHEIPFEMRI